MPFRPTRQICTVGNLLDLQNSSHAEIARPGPVNGWDSEALKAIGRNGYSEKQGARRIRNVAWLESYKGRTGPICSKALRKRLEAGRVRAGITKWQVNACRHSFASHWLADFKDASRLALLMDHA